MEKAGYYTQTKGYLIPRASDSERKVILVVKKGRLVREMSEVNIRHHRLEILRSKYLRPILGMFMDIV